MTLARTSSRTCSIVRFCFFSSAWNFCSQVESHFPALPKYWDLIVASCLSTSEDRKSTRLNSSHTVISYAVFCLTRRSPRSPLFPYTTLFRSGRHLLVDLVLDDARTYVVAHLFDREVLLLQLGLELLLAGRVALPGLAEVLGLDRRELLVDVGRSEEHTSELQSHSDLVCRLLLDSSLTQISTLSLHDALPIWPSPSRRSCSG